MTAFAADAAGGAGGDAWAALLRRFVGFASARLGGAAPARPGGAARRDVEAIAETFDVLAAVLDRRRRVVWATREEAVRAVADEERAAALAAERERRAAAERGNRVLRFVNDPRVEAAVLAIIVAALVVDVVPGLAPRRRSQKLGLSAFLCALFLGELALRVAAHAASAGGLRAGARVCFRAPIRYVDLACLVLEAITLARFVLGGDSGGHGVRGAAFRLVRGFKFLKFMKAARFYRSAYVRGKVAHFEMFVRTAFFVDDVIREHRLHLERAAALATNQRLYRSAQRAVVETRRARVLVDVLSLWPCDPRLRGAALRLCCAVLDDSNHATQAWFVARVARGEVLVVAAAELRGVAKALERHHRRAQAGVAPPLAAAPLADAVWTVRLLTRLLAGQNAPMQRCIRAQTGLTKAVSMLRELEDLLAVLAHPPPARTTALEKHLVCEVVDCLRAAMVGMRVENQDALARSAVPEILGGLLAADLGALAAAPRAPARGGGDAAALGGPREREAVAWSLRRSCVACLDAMVEGREPACPTRALLAARVDDRALGAALAECAARHVASPPPRCTPPYDFLADRDEVDVEHEIDHVVGDLIVALSSLRLRLRGVSAAEGPFRSLLAEVDVSWHGRVERVVFARPEFASSLTVAAQRRFEASVDLTSAETRMRELFSAGAAIMKEATYLHAIGRQSRWYGAVNDHYVSLKLRLYCLALLLNLHVMLNLRGRGDFASSVRAERRAGGAARRVPYRNLLTVALAAPVCVGYVALFLFSLICKYKPTVDGHVARLAAGGAPWAPGSAGEQLGRLLDRARSAAGAGAARAARARAAAARVGKALARSPVDESRALADGVAAEAEDVAGLARAPPAGLDLALLYGAAVALYAAAFGWDEHLAALTAALAGAAAPAVLRRRWDAPRSNAQLVAITLYDAVTGDMGVGGNALFRAGQESDMPNFKGSYLGRFPLVSADFWTSDHLSERSRSVDAFPGTRARGTLTLKRR